MKPAQEKSSSGWVQWLVTLTVIILWYAANILVLLGNKYLLSNSGFRQPVFLTLCHMVACVVLGLLFSATGCTGATKPLKSRVQFAKIVVLAVIFCATIVLGNASLKYLPVSFNQAIGATTPFFTALFAFFCQGSRENYLTYAALLPVMGGVVIASGGEPLFHALGFVMCMLATAGRAFKTVVQSMLMTDPAEKLDPMSLLLYMSSVCVALLVPMTLIMEPNALHQAAALTAKNPSFVYWMVINAVLAYFTNLLNFLVTKYTSALTMQVVGNAKGVVAAGVSILVFHNPVTAQGALGYAITVAGVFMYSETKRRTAAAKAQEKEHLLRTPSKEPGGVREPLLAEHVHASGSSRLQVSSSGGNGSGGGSSQQAHFRHLDFDAVSKV